jgi:peptide deformylase
MALKRTLQLGDPRLKAVNLPVKDFQSPALTQAIQDLSDTMVHNSLIGMAAPQIGVNLNIFVTQPRKTKTRDLNTDQLRIYLNPTIIHYSKIQNLIYEGCGSVMHGKLFGPVIRPQEITLKAQDEKGRWFTLACNGILARVIQHEYDHLFGVEFTEKISNYKKLMSLRFYQKMMLHPAPILVSASQTTILEFKYL